MKFDEFGGSKSTARKESFQVGENKQSFGSWGELPPFPQ